MVVAMPTDAFDEVLTELSAMSSAPAHLGRALAHCAQSIDYSVQGFPRMKPAWFQKTIGRLVLKKFLRQGYLKHDVNAPVPGAPELPETSFEQGVQRLREAISAFRAHPGPLAPHFAYGQVARDDYARVHVMHIR